MQKKTNEFSATFITILHFPWVTGLQAEGLEGITNNSESAKMQFK